MGNPIKPIRILLADDHPVLRQGVRALAADEDDMEFVAEAIQRTGSNPRVPEAPARRRAHGFADARHERHRRNDGDSK